MDKWLQNNNVIKLIAFLLAIMLWLIVNDEGNLFRSRQADNIVTNVPLTVRYDEDRFGDPQNARFSGSLSSRAYPLHEEGHSLPL